MAPRIRAVDAREAIRAADFGPTEALETSAEASTRCLTVDWGGRPIAMFGVAPGPLSPHHRMGYIWLLGTDDLLRHTKTFMRVTPHWVAFISEGYDMVGNYVDAENAVHIRWLKRAGFTFLEPQAYGPYDSKFIPFWKVP